MSESTAEKFAASISSEESAPNTTDTIEDQEETQAVEPDESTETEEESTETEESEDEPQEEELPDTVKEILKKNRKELREVKARAVAAEKALAAKEKTGEEAPADTKFKDLYLKSAAKAALVEAGVTTSTDRFLKMLDLSSVEVDESGNITGLDDQIEDLKEDFKDILAPKTVRKTVGKVDGSRREVPATPKTSAERMASLLK